MDERFEFLIGFLATWGWQSLGKVPNPATGKAEADLDAAARVIGILEMIEAKTSGNLSADEARLLEQALTDLRLNYVDEASRANRGAQAGQSNENTDQAHSEQSS